MTLIPLFNLALRKLMKRQHSCDIRSWEVRSHLQQLRRELLPTKEELDKQYLAESKDLYDLEQRMRELDRPRRPASWAWPPN